MSTKKRKPVKIGDARKPVLGWELHSDLFEIHWKRGETGVYADKVRICGTTFHYIGLVPKRKESK